MKCSDALEQFLNVNNWGKIGVKRLYVDQTMEQFRSAVNPDIARVLRISESANEPYNQGRRNSFEVVDARP